MRPAESRGPRASARRRHNQARVRKIAAAAPTDLEALALLFESDALIDDGTLRGRLAAILDATERRTIPGLHTAVPFGDTGFAGDRRIVGGAGFRDPWASSRNQVGHFLTAVRMRVAPEVISQRIPLLGSVRAIVAAPPGMSDAEVALRLSLGHEKRTDPPNGVAAAMAALERGLGAYKRAVAADADVGAALKWFALAAVGEAVRQFQGSLATFRAQFQATTPDDVSAFNRAVRLCARGRDRDVDRACLEGPDSPLAAIAVGSGEGNSRQDLRLTAVGWLLGELILDGTVRDRHAVAAWLRRNLG